MPSLPMPFRAVVGLAAAAVEEARRFPDRAIELPMLAVSTALQMSLRAQQRYAYFASRGDDILSRREVTDDAPPWATFDAPFDPNAPFDRDAAFDAPFDPNSPGPLDEPVDLDTPDGEPKPRARKTVRRPRNGRSSAFDAVGDD